MQDYEKKWGLGKEAVEKRNNDKDVILGRKFKKLETDLQVLRCKWLLELGFEIGEYDVLLFECCQYQCGSTKRNLNSDSSCRNE